MKYLNTYETNTKDNRFFQKISGDNNKIHYDKHFCSETHFKSPLVYGQSIVIYVLIQLKKKKIIENLGFIEKIYCKFDKPIFLDEKIEIYFNIYKKDSIVIKIFNKLKLKSIIKITTKKVELKKLKEKNLKYFSTKCKIDNEEHNLIKFLALLSNKAGNYKDKINLTSHFEVFLEKKSAKIEKYHEIKNELKLVLQPVHLVKLEKGYRKHFARVYFFRWLIK